MATGIQTGMRRGQRTGIVGPEKVQSPTVIRSFQELWRSLSARTKTGIALGFITFLLGTVGFTVHRQANRYVDLYPSKMVSKDVPEVSRALLEMGIDHEVTPTDDGILLHHTQKTRALAGLASRDLPLHPVTTSSDAVPAMPATSLQQKALHQRILAGEITLALRAIEGINDARVTLAVPEKAYFHDDNKKAKASVILTLVPGHPLSREGVRGILKMIAASVPELGSENVHLSDTQGRISRPSYLATLREGSKWPGPNSKSATSKRDANRKNCSLS